MAAVSRLSVNVALLRGVATRLMQARGHRALDGVAVEVGGVHGEPRDWRKLHNEELYYMFSSRNVRWVSRSRSMRWAGHVARVGDRRGAYRET